ncbi:MAG: thymidylate kinase [Clostridiaceae bacterium]|nr:thymidylate kinase [Clostridiaceae bacterium]
MGRLIVIDGVDSSGKETHAKLLQEKIKNSKLISFPNYQSPSSTLVKMYLEGAFGKNANDVSPYAASSFFAMDRYASFKMEWEKDFLGGATIICDRYVTSNMIHQASKIDNLTKKDEFLAWLWDFEYEKLKLPKPDIVIFLDMPVEYSIELMKNRKNKINGQNKKDIHEEDYSYLKKSYENALYVAEKYNWAKISCVCENGLKSIEEIQKEILEKLK